MTSTRRAMPIDIFQDDSGDLPLPQPYDAQPHTSSPLDGAPVLALPPDSFVGPSPQKQPHRSSSPLRVVFGDKVNISLPPSLAPASTFMPGSPTKRMTASAYQPITMQKRPQPIFSAFPSAGPRNKENVRPTYHSDNFAEFPDPTYGPKPPGKRTSTDAQPSDREAKKTRIREPVQLPEPKDMPRIEDDGTKPPYSYAVLIGMSILRAPNRRLTLAQIYKWISDSFSHYHVDEPGWQNSIRHNLSLNKSFIKQERPKDDPGKGNYWAIEPGMEHTFLKEKPCRRPASSSGPSVKAVAPPAAEPSVAPSVALPPIVEQPEGAPVDDAEPSSDATIAASEIAVQDGYDGRPLNMPPPARRHSMSSPLHHIGSSPPAIPFTRLSREGTPSRVIDFSSSANPSRTRKRKFHSMNDSGYFSSIESSALRSNGFGLVDPDIIAPRFKRGRAEEEIARIRSSSHDISPIAGRSTFKQPTFSPNSSSPTRYLDILQPLTPAVVFKKPAKPPASVSPNTNLRNHRNRIRELVGSPIKGSGAEVTFSPAFKIVEDDPDNFHDTLNVAFDVFSDSPYNRRANGSPIKRSAKRPQLARALSTASVLADITGASTNSKANPMFTAPCLGSPLRHRSPSKSPIRPISPYRTPKFGATPDMCGDGEFFGLDFFNASEETDFGGIDLMQGFQKIGDKENEAIGKRKDKAGRPPFGARSATSRF